MSLPLPPDNKRRSTDRRQQARWAAVGQIYLPLLAVMLIAGGLVWLVSTSGGTARNAQWAEVVEVMLLTPLLLLGIGALAITGVLIWGVWRLSNVITTYTPQIQDRLELINAHTQHWAGRGVNVFVVIHEWLAGIQGMLARVRSILRGEGRR